MNPVLIFALIVGPTTALLVWVIFCELRGVPAFADGLSPQPGELDAMGRWILGGFCLVLAGTAFAYGGVVAVLDIAPIIVALATSIALVWTLEQSTKQCLARKRDSRNGAGMPHASAHSAPAHG